MKAINLLEDAASHLKEAASAFTGTNNNQEMKESLKRSTDFIANLYSRPSLKNSIEYSEDIPDFDSLLVLIGKECGHLCNSVGLN